MTRTHNDSSQQLGFDALLADTDAQNQKRQFERETAGLPGEMEQGLSHYRQLIGAHHRAMMAADGEEIIRIRDEAHLLATKLNSGESGILAGSDAPGSVLMARTAAPDGQVPRWGQVGNFTLEIASTPVRIEMEGMLGIASHTHWLGFAIHAVDWEKPFLSNTGYRSFLGVCIDMKPDLAPDAFVEYALNTYLRDDLGGALEPIDARYRQEC